MIKESIIVAVVIVAAAFVLAGCSPQQSPATGRQGAPAVTSAQAQPSSQSANASRGIRFQDTPYARYAYLISDNTISPDAETALAGFQVQRETQPDGSLKVTLKALQSEYHDQSYVVQPGQKLYFIEESMGDDVDGKDYSLSDDTAVLVDSDGYVINQ